jgi:hypothetical protein
MKKNHIQIFYLVILSLNLPFISLDSIHAAAAAAARSSADTAQDTSYPPKDWYLKCFCWNTSWSEIEWQRYVLWELSQMNVKDRDGNIIVFDEDLKNITKDNGSFFNNTRPNTFENFKTSKISTDLCNKLIPKITCHNINQKELAFTIEFSENINSNLQRASPKKTVQEFKEPLKEKLKDHFQEQMNLLVRNILSNNYDIICLQECPSPFMQIMKNNKPLTDTYEFCYDKHNTLSGCCIIYKKMDHQHTQQTCKTHNTNNIRSQEVQIEIPPVDRSAQDPIFTTIASIHFKKDIKEQLVEAPNIEKSTELGEELNGFIIRINFNNSDSKDTKKPAIIFGDFNTSYIQISLLLNAKYKNQNPFFVGDSPTQDAIDHFIFNGDIFESFESIAAQKIDANFYQKTNKSHVPFVTNIIHKDIFIVSKIKPFIEKVNEVIVDKDTDSGDILKDSETLRNNLLKLLLEYVKNKYEIDTDSDFSNSLNQAIDSLKQSVTQPSASEEDTTPRRAKKKAAQAHAQEEQQKDLNKEFIIEITKLSKIIDNLTKINNNTEADINKNFDSLLESAKNIFYINRNNEEEIKKNGVRRVGEHTYQKKAIEYNLESLRKDTNTVNKKSIIDEILSQIRPYLRNKNKKCSDELVSLKDLNHAIFEIPTQKDQNIKHLQEQNEIDANIETIKKGDSFSYTSERMPFQIIQTLQLQKKAPDLILKFLYFNKDLEKFDEDLEKDTLLEGLRALQTNVNNDNDNNDDETEYNFASPAKSPSKGSAGASPKKSPKGKKPH